MPKHNKSKHQSSSESPSSDSCEDFTKGYKSEPFEHNITFQLISSTGSPIAGTQFEVTLTILKEGPKIIIQFPVINFQTESPSGFLYTVAGFLPKEVRPNDLVYRSFLAPSGNGTALPFVPTQPPPPLPTPPSGYIVQITNAGLIIIACAGTFGNLIPSGPQTMLPTDVTYLIKAKIKLGENYIIGPGFTNTTQFTGGAANDGFRDSHVNDAFDNVLAWAWTDNSTQADKTNGTMDTLVAFGRVNKKGQLKVSAPINLTNFGPKIQSWDTAVAINRTNKYNAVVSYGVINRSVTPLTVKAYRAVLQSFDQGKTWVVTANGPLNVQPTGNPSQFGDCRGVSADKFGNFWYSFTNAFDDLGNFIGQPVFLASSDGGLTFQIVYTIPLPLPANIGPDSLDYPQYCFGGNGQSPNQYGVQFVADYLIGGNTTPRPATYPVVGFIPINGLGNYGSGEFEQLTTFLDNNVMSDVTASVDGRVWYQGFPHNPSHLQPNCVVFKSPGAININYAGPWQYETSDEITDKQTSQPVRGYFFNSVQSVIYDDARQALYIAIAGQTPDDSQNMRIYFLISRNNGQSWSQPIDLSNTDFANRGFQSMALDSATGNLVFGWYDGRNGSNFADVQYFGAVITSKELDKLVNQIPLSNPLYTLPLAVASPQSSDERDVKLYKIRQKRHE